MVKPSYSFSALVLLGSLCLAPLPAVADSEMADNWRAFEQSGYNPYRQPATTEPTREQQALNCRQLEQAIARLVPDTYSYKPDFYNDPYQGTSVWVGTAVFQPAYLLSVYSGVTGYRERARKISAQDQIEILRRAKAERRCFES